MWVPYNPILGKCLSISVAHTRLNKVSFNAEYNRTELIGPLEIWE